MDPFSTAGWPTPPAKLSGNPDELERYRASILEAYQAESWVCLQGEIMDSVIRSLFSDMGSPIDSNEDAIDRLIDAKWLDSTARVHRSVTGLQCSGLERLRTGQWSAERWGPVVTCRKPTCLACRAYAQFRLIVAGFSAPPGRLFYRVLDSVDGHQRAQASSDFRWTGKRSSATLLGWIEDLQVAYRTNSGSAVLPIRKRHGIWWGDPTKKLYPETWWPEFSTEGNTVEILEPGACIGAWELEPDIQGLDWLLNEVTYTTPIQAQLNDDAEGPQAGWGTVLVAIESRERYEYTQRFPKWVDPANVMTSRLPRRYRAKGTRNRTKRTSFRGRILAD